MSKEFRYEKELQARLASLELDLAGDYITTYYRREVNMGLCIPDLIYVRFTEIPDGRLWPRNITYRHAHIIWLLRKYGRQTTEALASHGFIHSSLHFQTTISDLFKVNALIKHDDSSLSLSEDLLGVRGEVITVEAKLKRWRQALEQAKSYKEWSDFVFVAMDTNHTPTKSKILDEFRETGIGLCSISPESTKFKWSVMPKRIKEQSSFDKEYLIASAASPYKNAYWDVRNRSKALCQVAT